MGWMTDFYIGDKKKAALKACNNLGFEIEENNAKEVLLALCDLSKKTSTSQSILMHEWF